ncbi:CRISPR-associated helicase/endonuclease Cas3 [Lachnobacterium bovis]|uniref:CRISPR-associated helicase/endonuclease Cas3 n=1 Tax=Lachnobacterium bovis TaxID=140626 RepID=UPI0004901434|nr:CRISPR-associated helicase/endonuclease Cas3 [Lachnobacterium bovis]
MEKINLNLLAKSNPELTIRQHTDDVIECAKILSDNYKMDKKIRELLFKSCEYHDYGKFNEEFQNRIKNGGKFNDEKELPHNFLSIFFIDKNDFDNEEEYYIVCYSVLYHHSFRNESVNDLVLDKKILKNSLLECVEHFNVKRRDFKKIEAVRNINKTILVKGLLNRCDYAASAGNIVEINNNFLLSKIDGMLNEWKEVNENAKWNNMQEFCMENADKNLMITAATGMGKTEGSLLWLGDNKGFYVLPLRSAINSIFLRVVNDILKGEEIENRVALLHSDNLGFIAKQEEKSLSEIDLKTYKSKSKQFAMPITISTPDQLFDFVFKTDNYEMKLATLANSKVIIDEIQAYDATMLSYLIKGIHDIMELGGKIAIFTATLPPFVKELLMKDCNNNTYDFTIGEFNPDSVRHNLKTLNEELNVDRIVKKANENYLEKKSNKILVICNTVKKAQEVFDSLKESIQNEEIEIKMLHSKFIKKDRTKLEKEIGQDGKTEVSKNVIWVATQIVEASLDIDFDYLYTELSDLNGLFQRLGRCNRKGRKNTNDTNCFVFTEIFENIINRSGDKGFIDGTLYDLSKKAINGWDGSISEKQKVDLINTFFTMDKLKKSNYMKIYRSSEMNLYDMDVNELSSEEKAKKFRNIISYTIIPTDVYNSQKDYIDELLQKIKSIKVNNQNDWKEYQKCIDVINELTVDVGLYDMGCFSSDVVETEFNLTQYQKIYVLKCNYDAVRGYSRVSRDESNSSLEDDYGVFI